MALSVGLMVFGLAGRVCGAEGPGLPAGRPALLAMAGGVADDAGSVACPVCNGTGTLGPQCQLCGGSGKCRSCRGAGVRAPQMKGGSSVMCIACRGTGKCSACGGTGTAKDSVASQPCPTCKGTGKVAAAGPAPSPAPTPAGEAGPSRTAAPAKPQAAGLAANPGAKVQEAREAASELDNYAKTMKAMDEQLAAGSVGRADFDAVLTNPSNFAGNLYQCRVALLQAHPRGVRVASGAATVRQGGRMILPRTPQIGEKAEKVLETVKECGIVTVTIGVVNSDNITLFDIEAGYPPASRISHGS